MSLRKLLSVRLRPFTRRTPFAAGAAAIGLAFASLTASPTAIAAVQATHTAGSGDVGALAYCSSSRPQPGSVPWGHFGGDQQTACRKCDESARVQRAKGRISAYACEYNGSVGEAWASVIWTCPWPLKPPCAA